MNGQVFMATKMNLNMAQTSRRRQHRSNSREGNPFGHSDLSRDWKQKTFKECLELMRLARVNSKHANVVTPLSAPAFRFRDMSSFSLSTADAMNSERNIGHHVSSEFGSIRRSDGRVKFHCFFSRYDRAWAIQFRHSIMSLSDKHFQLNFQAHSKIERKA
jgi:hypothetical protein